VDRRHFLGACSLGGAALWGDAVAQVDAALPYTWKNLPFGGGGFITGMVVHPRAPGLAYVRAERGGLYRRDSVEGAWIPLLDGMGGDEADWMCVLSMAVDPQDPQRVYAACGATTGEWSHKAAVLVSTDRGNHWTIQEQRFRLGGDEGGRGSGERLQVDPADGRILVLGSTKDGLLRSTDGGAKFSALSFPGTHVSLVLFDPSAGGKVLYAGCVDQPGLYASRDGGARFEREAGAPAQIPQRAAFGPDGTLFVSFAAGSEWAPNPGNLHGGSVWKRTPGGVWSDITPNKPDGRPFAYGALDVDARGRVVASMLLENWDGGGDELYLSVDGGAQWIALSSRSGHDTHGHPWLAQHLAGGEAMGHQIAVARFDPANPERLSYGTQYGLWTTDSLGAVAGAASVVKWRFDVRGIEQAPAAQLHSPAGGVMLFAAMGGGLGGGAWEDANRAPDTGLFKPCRDSHRSVDSAWLAPQFVARTIEADGGGAVSVNGGANWLPFGPQSLVKDARGGHVAVSAKGGMIVWAPARQPALVSRDHGRSWALCKGWPETRDVDLVPVAEKNVEGVFYVLDITQGQVLVSVDGGASFAPNLTGLPKLNAGWQHGILVSAPGRLRDLWIGLSDRLMHVVGVDEPLTTLRSVYGVRHLALGKAAAGSAYHSVYMIGTLNRDGIGVDGLHRSDDAGATFRLIDDPRHRFGSVEALAADPLEPGTVYVGTKGRGILIGWPGA
jgi:hypothetical protein